MSEQIIDTTRQPLKPHKYPILIVIAALGILGLFLYSLFFVIPQYRQAYQQLTIGKEAYVKQDWSQATEALWKVVALVPSSENGKVELAKALFANGIEGDDLDALVLLEDISLNPTEWRELQRVMPDSYEQLFNTKTK